MLPTTWTRRQQVSPSGSLPSPTAILQSFTFAKEFKSSSPSSISSSSASDRKGSSSSNLVQGQPRPIEGARLNVKQYTKTATYSTTYEEHSNPAGPTTMLQQARPVTPDDMNSPSSTDSTIHTTNFFYKNNNRIHPDNQPHTPHHQPNTSHSTPGTPVTPGTPGTRWSNLRNKTATKLRLAVERSRQAEMLGVDRTRKQKIIHRRETNAASQHQSHAASSTGALSSNDEFSDHHTSDYHHHHDDDATDAPYQPPTSSCDGDVLSVGSAGSPRENATSLAGTIMNAARTVDRKRTVERNRAFEAHLTHHAMLANVAKAARRNSKTVVVPGTVPNAPGDARSVGSKESLDSFGKSRNEIPFSEVKRRMNGLRKENRSLFGQKEDLQRMLNKERQENLRMLKEARKEVEERNLKLAVLEEHFIALNEHDDADFDVLENGGLSFDSTDTPLTKGGSSIRGDDPIPEDGNEHHPGENGSLKSIGETGSHKSSSIVRLDKSYLTSLKRSYEQTKLELAKLKHDNAERHTVKAEMMRQLEDLSERLRCRETTIASLDEALKQMRAARFKQKTTPTKKRGHKRRSTLHEMSSVTPIIENETESTLPVNVQKDNYKINEVIIDDAVKEALEIKGKEHAEEISSMQNKLDLKDTLIKKLRLKNGSLKRMESSKRALSSRNLSSRNLDPSSDAFTVRDMNMTNEMMNTLTFRLERMMAKIEESMQTPAESIYDVSVDLPDEMRPIRKLAAKISLANDEMKVTMKLIEQRLKNGVESIKNGNIGNDSNELVDRPKSAGQDTSSGDKRATESTVNSLRPEQRSGQNQNEALEELQAQVTKMLRETEVNLAKDIKDLKYQVQDIEVDMESKQDTIEALELACSEHDRNCRSLQEQMSVLVMRLEERADQEIGELHDRYKAVEPVVEEAA